MSNYIENSGMYEKKSPEFGSASGNNFKDAYKRIDPRMKTCLARSWFVFCLLVSPKRGIKMAIIGFLGSISINISGPSSILEFVEMK